MESKFIPADVEEKLYRQWEERGYFTAKVVKDKKTFSIIFPPPNANADLHLGHAMYVYEDVMIRYYKLQGYETLWMAGADHAGIETQFVFEKHLKKEDKSRFDFDRQTLFQMIWDFVMKNRSTMEDQCRRLGFALDWSKKKFTMDEDIVRIVHQTFADFYKDGLVYRADRLVNYCTRCGTSFSDLEVVNKEQTGKLYYIRFPVKQGGYITIATTRPETFVGDVAVMVNPKDKRYKDLIGKTVVLPLVNREIPIIADSYVDMKFGTGAVKVTPAHDFNDFEIAKKHNLSYPPIIGFDGKMQNTGVVDGMRVLAAREEIVARVEKEELIEKIEPHEMVIKVCYRCGTVLEPLPKEQWYINVKPMTAQAIKLVEEDSIKVYPKRFKKQLIRILEDFIDWNISRQIVWGIRIPAFYDTQDKKWVVEADADKQKKLQADSRYEQDTDTFDTWFSSAQWPFATLQSVSTPDADYFSQFYPTTVMETGYDILRAWVARMIMVGKYATNKVPFEHIFLHGMVRDKQGQKMSKSKGNVINPLVMIDKYGADALRSALIFGTKEGGDVVLSEQKIVAMRNFANKLWNMGRFIYMNRSENSKGISQKSESEKLLKELEKEFAKVEKKYHTHMTKYEFAKAFDLMYDFTWHRLADYYIEQLKDDIRNGNMEVLKRLKSVYLQSLRCIHPYMPFVTDAIWQVFEGKDTSILLRSN